VVRHPVEMLLNHEHLTLQESEAVAAALETFRRRPTLGFSDCLLVELARKAGHLPLGTFDRDLGKVDGAAKLQVPGSLEGGDETGLRVLGAKSRMPGDPGRHAGTRRFVIVESERVKPVVTGPQRTW